MADTEKSRKIERKNGKKLHTSHIYLTVKFGHCSMGQSKVRGKECVDHKNCSAPYWICDRLNIILELCGNEILFLYLSNPYLSFIKIVYFYQIYSILSLLNAVQETVLVSASRGVGTRRCGRQKLVHSNVHRREVLRYRKVELCWAQIPKEENWCVLPQ